LRNEGASTHRKKGEQLNLKQETPVATGTFTPGNGWQEIRLDRQYTGRFFCLEALSAQDGKKIAAIAELDVLGADGKPISREKWRIRYADSEETRSGNCTGDKVFDLQESTYWMTVARDAYPHQLVIDLGGDYTVTGFRYLPRAEKGYPGMIKDYRVYVKGEEFQY
jgi:beta-galactosidase